MADEEKPNLWSFLTDVQKFQAEQDRRREQQKADDSTVVLYLLGSLGVCAIGLSLVLLFAGGLQVFLGIGTILAGLILLVRGAQRRAIESLFKRYAIVIANNPNLYVADLAASMRITPEEVRKDFEMFSRRRLMTDVVIDEHSGRLIYGNGLSSSAATQDYQPQQNSKLVEVECRGCGAKKMVAVGGKSICDHCGSELLG